MTRRANRWGPVTRAIHHGYEPGRTLGALIPPIFMTSTYLNGHGDVLGGAVIGSAADVHLVRDRGLRFITGATLSPMSCYLVLRGIKTLISAWGSTARTGWRLPARWPPTRL